MSQGSLPAKQAVSLVQPILETEPWNSGEINRVPRQECRSVYDRDGGDLEIHGAAANALAAEVNELVRGPAIPREHSPAGKKLQAAAQPLIGIDLLVRVNLAVDLGKPASQLFLRRNNGGCNLLPGILKPPSQPVSRLGTSLQGGQVVSIKNEHGCSGFPDPADTSCQAGSFPQSRDHPSIDPPWRANLFCAAIFWRDH